MTESKANTSKNTTASKACSHCGEPCNDALFQLEDKTFCCVGCQTVYQILHENNLGDFYNIENTPGVSQKNNDPSKYDWLDEADIAARLLDYQDEKRTKITLRLPQIHCASCVWLLENLHKLHVGILSSKVNFMKREAYITFNHNSISLRELAELLVKIGYAPNIGLEQLNQTVKPVKDRTLIYQIGLAGFAFGNIMLFSFPEYLGLEVGIDGIFRQVFGWLNLALAIPVLLYSGRDYIRSAWHGLRHGNLNIDVPVSLGMLALFLRSSYEVITATGAGYFDSLAGLVFFLLIGKWFQRQTYNHLTFDKDYESYFPVAATVVEADGTEKSVSLPKLEIGNRLLIRHGELIPADGVLVSDNASIDYGFVTGEAEPVQKKKDDILYAGGKQTKGAFEMLITKKPSQSYLVRLWNDEAFEENPSQTKLLADKVGQRFTYVVLTIAAVTLAYWLWQGAIPTAINAFTAVLIIACPCAVALAIPFTFGTASRIISRQRVYLKDTAIIEKLREIDATVFDKTGTLTSANNSQVTYTGQAINDEIINLLNALTRQSGHPLSRHINQWAAAKSKETIQANDFEEVIGQGISGHYNNVSLKLGSKQFTQAQSLSAEHDYARVYLSVNGAFYGSFSFVGQYRTGLDNVISWAKNQGNIYLLSGDNEREREHLSPIFGNDNLYFSQSPHDKLHFIKSLQEKKRRVLMFGDGLNDAGALRRSDVGIVLTENTNNFVPACDAIVDAASFDKLPTIISFLKKTVNVVYASYILAFIYNIFGLSYAVTGTLSPVVAAILMPLSSVTVVVFGVVTSQLLAKRHKI